MAAIIDQNSKIASNYMESVPQDLQFIDAKDVSTESSSLANGIKSLDVNVNGLNKLPGEIRDKIFKLAMTAENGIISMPCLSNKTFKPNVATALLRTW